VWHVFILSFVARRLIIVVEPNEMTTIRLARVEELDSVYSLVQEAIRHMEEQGIPQWDEIYPSKAILNADIENKQMYLIEAEGQVAGMTVINEDQSPEYADVDWKYDGRALVVHRLTIHPDFQRRKLASSLMTLLKRWRPLKTTTASVWMPSHAMLQRSPCMKIVVTEELE
jgi:ribosomal protein S18 acetylase RimI-like enzyme